jgi:aspartyl-tRNA(Asn)/glutamyl-tRNA(Gln) amidotransferase subunit A
MTVRELGVLLRSGKASSVELTEEAITKAKNDQLRAFITITADQAIAEAKERDQELATGTDRGEFHGIPIGFKDLFYTRGVRTTGGSLIYKDFVPGYDATVVQKLRMAGAIGIAKLNLHELAYGATSKNPHYGFVLNPHDRTRVAGGSSGGSAAAIAAGILPMALGSDTGGSVRIPASYCGVAGFKPTYGLVSRYGVMPLAFSLDHVGPLGATVKDCALAMATIAGHDASDASSSPIPVPDFLKAPPSGLKGLRLGIPKNFYFDHVHHEVSAQVNNAIREMERLGASAHEVELPNIPDLNVAARIIQWGEASSHYTEHQDGSLFGKDVWALIEQGRLVSAPDYVNAQRMRTVARRRFDELWKHIDVLVTPTTPITAPRTDEDEVDIDGYREDARVASTRLTRAINLIGEPALSMPWGHSQAGMPIGLQLVGAPFTDAKLLGIGQTLERELAGSL